MSNQDVLLGVIQQGWSELTTAIDSDNRAPDEDAGDGWQVKDLMAHVAPWERMGARKITRNPSPIGDELAEREPWDLDRFNEAQRELWWNIENGRAPGRTGRRPSGACQRRRVGTR